MKNAVQDGRVITVPAPAGGAESGSCLIVGNLFGVAAYTVAEGQPLELVTKGVFLLPKVSSAVFAIGDRVAWDAATNMIDVPASGRMPIGIATEAAGDGIGTLSVRLDGVATAVLA
jgi:predicted RecA/RadA family phage recombinase